MFLWSVSVSVSVWCGKSGWLVREADSRTIAPRYRETETETETERIDRSRRRREGKWCVAEPVVRGRGMRGQVVHARASGAWHSHPPVQPQPSARYSHSSLQPHHATATAAQMHTLRVAQSGRVIGW